MSVTMLGGRTSADIAARHRPLLDALATGDPERAEAAVRRHILELADELSASLPGPSAGSDGRADAKSARG